MSELPTIRPWAPDLNGALVCPSNAFLLAHHSHRPSRRHVQAQVVSAPAYAVIGRVNRIATLPESWLERHSWAVWLRIQLYICFNPYPLARPQDANGSAVIDSPIQLNISDRTGRSPRSESEAQIREWDGGIC